MTSLGIDKQKMNTDEFKQLLMNTFEDKCFSPHEPTLPPDKLRVWKQTEARMGTHSFFFTLFFFSLAEYRRQITEGPPDQLRVWKQTEARMGTHSLCFRAFFLWTYSFFFFSPLWWSAMHR
jgi:hypothetical protein